MNRDEAAKRLGVPVNEVIETADSPAGTIITTFDGVRYIDVAEDNPDAEGNSGLMMLTAPTSSYGGAFPVFAQPGADPKPAEDLDALGKLKVEVQERMEQASGATTEQLARIEQRLVRLEGERPIDSKEDPTPGEPPAGSAPMSATTAAEQEATTRNTDGDAQPRGRTGRDKS